MIDCEVPMTPKFSGFHPCPCWETAEFRLSNGNENADGLQSDFIKENKSLFTASLSRGNSAPFV